jgi:iron-sulfur cluster assembly protein
MSITLTEKAAQRVQNFLVNRGSGLGIRLAVQTTGCSGLGYNLEFVDTTNDDDTIFEDRGVKVVVDAKSLIYLDGTEVDYVKEGLNKGECGCGESFTV